ncbi:MAG: hypothetical protein WBF47_16250 [Xanthobacteraceae bacterium]|jgi:tripartite-type tricarboxylate transporter receptor subunit TctC
MKQAPGTVSARPRTPPPKSSTGSTKKLADPEIKARLADLGAVPMPMTPAEFSKFIADETEKWGKVIRAANIKPG